MYGKQQLVANGQFVNGCVSGCLNKYLPALVQLNPNIGNDITRSFSANGNGSTLVEDLLTLCYNNKHWDFKEAEEIINCAVDFIILNTCGNILQPNMKDFHMKGFNWVTSNLNAIAAFKRDQINQQQNPYPPNNSHQNTPYSSHINSNYQNNPYDNSQSTTSGLGSHIQVNNYQNTQQGYEMNKSAHINSSGHGVHVPNNIVNTPNNSTYNKPPVEPPKGFARISITNKIEKSNDSIIVDDEYCTYQRGYIVNELLNTKSSVICDNYIEKSIILPKGISDEDLDIVIIRLEEIESTESLDDILSSIQFLYDTYNITSLYSYIASLLANIGLISLEHRFKISDLPNTFPYLTSRNVLNEYLMELGIMEEMEKILFYNLKHKFSNISVLNIQLSKSDVKTGISEAVELLANANIAGKESLINKIQEAELGSVQILSIISKVPVLLLPWYFTYNFEEHLLEHKSMDALAMNDVYQQAFNELDDSTLYLDILDAGLNKYRVYKNGTISNTLCEYYIANINL